MLERIRIPERTDYAKTKDWLGRRFNTETFYFGVIGHKSIGME